MIFLTPKPTLISTAYAGAVSRRIFISHFLDSDLKVCGAQNLAGSAEWVIVGFSVPFGGSQPLPRQERLWKLWRLVDHFLLKIQSKMS